MDKQIRRLAYGIFALFALLFLQVNYVSLVAADDLITNPANTTRLIIAELETDRGDILARDGTVLAESKPTGGEYNYLRRYPQAELFSHLTGYYSIVFGTSELEQAYNSYLAAHSESLLASNFLDYLVGKPKEGASIVTTIDPKVQAAAAKALGDRPGAVFAMDPATGEILALVSVPPYDPNLLSSHDPKEITATWKSLNRDKSKPLLSKAENELYPPGSTFKIVTTAAALENGYGPDSTWKNPGELPLPLTNNTLKNFGGSACLGGASTITLEQAFTISCNVTFGEIGLKLGPEKLQAQAEAFGFNEDVPFDLPWEEGRFPPPEHFEGNDPLVAFAAIGQDEVAANPMQMALVASAIANDGVLMEPRLVTEVHDPDGRVLRQFEPEEFGQAISPQTARELTEMMVNVVDNGTGAAATVPGISVAGKTGTAQHGTGEDPHAWFVSFAPADDPQIAIGVVVLDGGDLGSETTGGQEAAPIAKRVIEAALRSDRSNGGN